MTSNRISEVVTEVKTLEPCLIINDGVTFCEHCKVHPAKRKFCSNACRQAAYRLSPAYEGSKAKHRLHSFNRRQRWIAAKTRDKHIVFDGRYGGHEATTVPALRDFERKKYLDWEALHGTPESVE